MINRSVFPHRDMEYPLNSHTMRVTFQRLPTIYIFYDDDRYNIYRYIYARRLILARLLIRLW